MMFLAVATVAAVSVPDASLTAFAQLCSSGISTPAVLSRADRSGWRRTGADAPRDFRPGSQRFKATDKGVLTLKVGDTTSAGEKRQVCGIFSQHTDPGLGGLTRQALGFAPIYSANGSSTFLAILDDKVLRPATNTALAAKAKREGRFYSIMVHSGDKDGSYILAMHVVAPVSGG